MAAKRSRASLSRSTASALRSEEHTSELQSRQYLVCRLLLEKKKSRYLAEMRAEITALRQLRFREVELACLRGLRFLQYAFVDFLGLCHFKQTYARSSHSPQP